MGSLNRRSLLFGSGLAAAIVASPRSSWGSGLEEAHTLSFDEHWNYGDKPWQSNPNQNISFDPKYTAILHINIENDLRIQATRLHFPTVIQGSENNLENNIDIVVKTINDMNSGNYQPSNADTYVYKGLQDFAFHSPHHLFVYIKNDGIDYDSRHPIWFGSSLLGSVYGKDKACKNRSFYDAIVQEDKRIKNGSKKFVYVKNFFQRHSFWGGYCKIGEDEGEVYSFNINAMTTAADSDDLNSSSIQIPLIIDPDTGNMGGGKPMLGK